MSYQPHQYNYDSQQHSRNNNNNNQGHNLSLPYSDGGSLNIDSIADYYTTTTTTTSSQHLHQQQQAPSFSRSPSPYSSSSLDPLATNPSQLKRPTSPYIPTERPKHPWNLPSAASSVISTADFSGSTAYNPSISDKRRLIHSWSSRPQSSVMDPNDQHHNQHQFTAIELHNQQFTNNSTPVRSRDPSGGSNNNELASLSSSPANKQRPASVYSTTEGRGGKKKQGFWASVKPKKFSFRPDGVKRPKKSDSVGNKKAKFSNERTMVHWIKAAMLMGSLSMTLLSFGENQITPYIGVALLVICLMMLIYATTTFQVRMEWLNMRRKDVVYYDRFAPSVLTVLVFGTFAFNAIDIWFNVDEHIIVFDKCPNPIL
ncbi:hypothetical protein K457DRAFT_124442 [Linnemannia elongata AG-77]|uniref:DUF202 domain-containing protein n=1 Tax=Linnemannia elongata AG-77 TaxID=1314771 RepID=A0A197K2Z9_9FUNG|nr:hypothetical protein K457DRAFT_124442 [Linnemannia elongata AG-77]